jgi:hypothetical protein
MTEEPRPKLNLWPIAAAACGLFGLLSYFMVFVRFETLRDTAALNLALVAGAVAAGLRGLVLARRRGGAWRTLGAGFGLFIAAASAGLLGAYVFELSSSLPEPTQVTLELSELPDLTLRDHDGREVALSSLRGNRALLVFYRGYW